MRQKDTQRLLQMVETTARVPKLVWQDCTKEHGMVAEPAKRQAKAACTAEVHHCFWK